MTSLPRFRTALPILATSLALALVLTLSAPPQLGIGPPHALASAASTAPAWTSQLKATWRKVYVPASIDRTGARDASRALNRFIASVPNRRVIVFRRGATYRMDHGLVIRNRRNLKFEGNGATLSSNPATAATEWDSLFALGGGNHNIVIRNFHFRGNSPKPGVYTGKKEGVHAVMIQGDNVRIHHVTVRGMYGDAFFIHQSGTSSGWSNNTYIHDSRVYSTGRNGVTIIAAKNTLIERVAFDKSGYCTLDIEPNNRNQGARNVTFRRNTAGTWSNAFVAAEGAPNSVVTGVKVNRNKVTGDSLETRIRLTTGRQNITFRNNTSLVRAAGPVLEFGYIDGLTVTGNKQPLRSGQVAKIWKSKDVVYKP